MAGIEYRPEIDGLRAIAVVPVILFHMGFSWIPGGFIGVDVFFVISGFLITSIIKKELEQGTFSFRDFWARRVRRVLPAMIFVTACTLAATYFFVFRPEQQGIGKQALAALLSVANIYFWRSTGDYWGAASDDSPFLHAWSLSVEEQFYLFFPIAMWLIFRFRSRWLHGCIATAVVGSLALFLWGPQAHPTATFYLLPTRVWELGAGCLLAVAFTNQPSKSSSLGIFAMVGLGMVVLSYMFFDTLSGGLGLAVVGTALIIAFGQTGLSKKLLSQGSVVHIGKISYSLYLWHWPVLVLAKHLGIDWPGVSDNVILASISYLLAVGTYHLIEKPTRRKSGTIPFVLVSGVLVAGVALGMAWEPRYYDTSSFRGAYIVHNCHPDNPVYDNNPVMFGTTVVDNTDWRSDAYRSEGIRIGDPSRNPEVVLLGDSHGCMWSSAIREVIEELEVNGSFFCIGGCSPFMSVPLEETERGWKMTLRETMQFDQARLRCLEKWKPKLVIIGRRWLRNVETSELEASDLLEFIALQGSKVLLIEAPPCLKLGNRNVTQWLAAQDVRPTAGEQKYLPCGYSEESEGQRLSVRRLAAKYEHVDFLPTYDLYAYEDKAMVLSGNNVMYLDDDHLLSFGAQKIVPRLRERISEILAK